jgi:hypothetical protein
MSKPCKYECGTQLTWDNVKGIFVESDGTHHTKERCGYIKSIKQPPGSRTERPITNSDARLAEIQKAHEENMQANRELVSAIRDLAAAIRGKA